MKDSRHVEILQELDRKSVVSVKELKELFGVTDMTIRRDLIDLEKQGLLVRVQMGIPSLLGLVRQQILSATI